MTMIPISTPDGSFDAWCARPAGTPRAAIIVIQEIFGVNEGIRQRCERWAAAGYLALAPDLFWRLQPGVELDPDVPEQFQQALVLMGKFDQTLGIADIKATTAVAREISGGKVGLVGYCLGGRLAYLNAAQSDIDASVGYYGVGIDGLLDQAPAIRHPLLLHIAEQDHFVLPEAQQRMHSGLAPYPLVTLADYPGVDHGFATESGKRRSEAAAQLADQRTTAFFTEHLG